MAVARGQVIDLTSDAGTSVFSKPALRHLEICLPWSLSTQHETLTQCPGVGQAASCAGGEEQTRAGAWPRLPSARCLLSAVRCPLSERT